MKKRILLFISMMVCSLAFVISANAGTATNARSYIGNHTLTAPGGYTLGADTGVTIDGVKTYCLDPGYKIPNTNVSCDAETLGNDLFGSAVRYILSYGKNDSEITTAIRIVGIVTGKSAMKFNSSQMTSKCSYIGAAYQAAAKAGVTVSNSSLGEITCDNGSLAKNYKVTGASVIDLAADALKYGKGAKSGSSNNKPTAKVTTKNGEAVITVDNSKGSDSVTVNINCSSETEGDCGEKTVGANKTATFKVKSKVNDSKQCGTFSATMSYKGANDLVCAEAKKFTCRKNDNGAQNFAGCSSTGANNGNNGSNGNGSNGSTVTEPITDPNGGGNTIHIKCDDKKKECPYNDSQIEISGDGDNICSTDGEVVKVGEAALYSQDVEDCIIDNEKFLVSSSNSGVCKTYCVEDYSFKSDSLLLSDKDMGPDGYATITAGSYFNFAKQNPKATEVGTVKCYTKLDLDSFRKEVENIAQESYAQYMKTVTNSCSCTTDENGVSKCTNVKTTTEYTAHYSNNAITFEPTVIPETSYPSSCANLQNVESTAASHKDIYEGQVTSLVNELRSCAEKAKDDINYDTCKSKVKFDYGYNEPSRDLTVVSENTTDEVHYKSECNGNYSSCTQTSSNVPEKQLNLGTGSSVKYPTLEYVEKISTITTEYNLNGIGICNDYNNGTSNYPVAESECTGEGKTWVEGWPISYDTPQNGYKYEITVSDFGHIKSSSTCKTLDHYLNGSKVVVGCKYQVNGCADDCKWICDPSDDACDYQECDGDCIWKCAGVGCLYDVGNGLALNYQPISMIDVNSSFAYLADRYSGVTAVAAGRNNVPKASQVAVTGNTSRNIDSINWGTAKGKATLDLIEDKGETIYDENSVNYSLEYKVTLTPSKITEIKNYNKNQTDGFLDASLSCKVVDKSMEYVTCTSKYLDQLKQDGTLVVNEANSAFKSIKDIPNYVSGYNIVSERKSGTGPAWK